MCFVDVDLMFASVGSYVSDASLFFGSFKDARFLLIGSCGRLATRFRLSMICDRRSCRSGPLFLRFCNVCTKLCS